MVERYKENWAAGFDLARADEMLKLALTEAKESLERSGFTLLVAAVADFGDGEKEVILWTGEPHVQPRVRKLAETARERILSEATE